MIYYCQFCNKPFQRRFHKKRYERTCWKAKHHGCPEHSPKDEIIQQLEKLMKSLQNSIKDLSDLQIAI